MSSSAWRKRRALKNRAAFARSKRRIVDEAAEERPPAEDPDNIRKIHPLFSYNLRRRCPKSL